MVVSAALSEALLLYNIHFLLVGSKIMKFTLKPTLENFVFKHLPLLSNF